MKYNGLKLNNNAKIRGVCIALILAYIPKYNDR